MKIINKYIPVIALLFLFNNAIHAQADSTKNINKSLLTDKWWSPDKNKNKNKNMFSQYFAADGTYTVSKGPKGKWSWDGDDLKITQGMSKYTYKVTKISENEFDFETMNTAVYFVKDNTIKKK
jgi:hypothetical protein